MHVNLTVWGNLVHASSCVCVRDRMQVCMRVAYVCLSGGYVGLKARRHGRPYASM